MRLTQRLHLGASALALAASAASYGHAQAPAPASNDASQPQALQEIVVTGTSIRGIAPVGAPVVAVSQKDIQNQPVTTTTDLLRQLPSVVGLGANANFGGALNNSNANITGGNGVNLRGLGTEATLTLLDGRRLPNGGVQGQYFDPSVFSTEAITRLEVLPDGGSAIYGADAVGGVINVITRRRYDGVEALAKAGFASGANQYQGAVLGGKGWGSGNVVFTYEYQHQDALAASARSLYTDNLTPYGQSDLRLFNAAPGNILISGVYYPIPAAAPGAITSAQLQAASAAHPANRESIDKGVTAIPGQDRHSAMLSVYQDITPDVTVWTEDFYAHRQLIQSIGAQTANLTVPATNAYFVAPTGVTLPNCPASAGAPAGTKCETVTYSFSNDFGPRVRNAYAQVYQGAAGIDAKLGGSWKLSAFASYGRDSEEREQYAINNPQLIAALNNSNPATALDPFGGGGVTNRQTLAAILGKAIVHTDNDLYDAVAKIDGSLLQLPGGPLKVAVGGEFQRQVFRYNTPDTINTPNVSIWETVLATDSRTVGSGFGEVFVPIVGSSNAMPGLRELAASAAVRYDSYSDFGSTTNPKFALKYSPFEGLSLRGTYGTSYQAPSLSDVLPATLGVTVSNFADPTSSSGQTQVLWLRGANTSLKPETAKISSVGADYKPTFLPRLSLSLTYYNVNYTNRIQNPGNTTTALSAAVAPLLGNLITRNPSATLVQYYLSLPQYTGTPVSPSSIGALVDGRFVNTGRLNTNGLEWSGTYSNTVGPVAMNYGLIGSYILRFDQSIFPNAPLTNVVSTFGNPVQFRMRGNIGAAYGPWSAQAYVNYTGAYKNNTITPIQSVGSYTTADLSLRYTLDRVVLGAKGVVLSLDCQNLFDQSPPVVPNTTPLAFDPQVASLMGRTVMVGLRAHW